MMSSGILIDNSNNLYDKGNEVMSSGILIDNSNNLYDKGNEVMYDVFRYSHR